MEKEILIKFGEIFLKGENKEKFEKTLFDNINQKISKFGIFNIKKMGSVLAISGENVEKILDIIKKVFGVALISRAYKINKNIEEIKKAAAEEITEKIKNKNIKSFKIEAQRSDKNFYLNSLEICSEIGAFISEKFNLKVDVHNPDLIIKIEIRNHAYVYSEKILGAGGLPVGTSGLGTVMISGGIDSPVAAFMMTKRGLKINAVHFSTPPYTSERSVDKVKRILKKISEYSGVIKFFNINFSEIQKEIKKNCVENLVTVISRRFMSKISQNIAILEKSSCLITGESLGQVASQTVSAINCTSHEIFLPVFRPLIGFDKSEIINIAKKIGTFEISIEDFEDCCSLFSPKRPKINPILKFVQNNELKIKNSNNLTENAIKNCEICEIN